VSQGRLLLPQPGEIARAARHSVIDDQVHAPVDGEVQRILFAAGDQVREGDLLVELSEDTEATD